MKFIEVLRDGLTVERKVHMAGDRIQVTGAFNVVSKKKQVKRWGAPRYREITRADFEGVGGKIVNPEPEDEAQEDVPGEVVVEDVPGEVPENYFAALDGLDVEETLVVAANFTDEQTAAFIVYEQEGENRLEVLNALSAEPSEN
jgi:hypothetical protein